MKLSAHARNAAAAAVGAELNNGFFRIYAKDTLLAETRFNPRAFLTARDGAMEANALPQCRALAKGKATRFAALKADGKTLVYEGTVGTEPAADLVISSVDIQVGAILTIEGITYTQPE